MLNILSGLDKFKMIGPATTFNMTAKIESAFQRRLHRLESNDLIPLTVYNIVRHVGSQLPKLYGFPKTRNVGTPVRPELSMVASPQHKIAK